MIITCWLLYFRHAHEQYAEMRPTIPTTTSSDSLTGARDAWCGVHAWPTLAAVTAALVTCCLALAARRLTGTQSGQPQNEFCYVNHFAPSELFRPVVNATPDNGGNLLTLNINNYVNSGQPFVVSGVTAGWPASKKWTHAYFRELFRIHPLFSSTFSTPERPSLETVSARNVYYGIFLNNASLAALLAQDYAFPPFIPAKWRVRGQCLSRCTWLVLRVM